MRQDSGSTGDALVFNSIQYALFLPVVVGLYWVVRRHRPQNGLLLIASYIFYGAWDFRFLSLMWLSTATDYTVGRLLGNTSDDRKRKRIFLISLVVNLGILGFFKYFDFFADSAAELLQKLGFEAHAPTLRIALPIGISFYTFHGISYTFDVYRRNIEPARDILSFAVFIAYFPQLVAGPIGRAHVQLPQFENPRVRASADDIRSGLFLILLGLFKKVAIADALAPYVNDAFARSDSAGAVTLLIGVYAFALQIYGDFSGYSDMARGSSRLFGIELLRNFDQPYLSRNVTEFWRTWHISLSTWLRDYLYVPLGGNRRGFVATYRNLMLTMLLGGLWHGAAWTFVIWGGLHGLYLCVHRMLDRRARPTAKVMPSTADASGLPVPGRRDLLRVIATFHLICFAWVFFRADSFTQARQVLSGIFGLRSGPIAGDALVLLLLSLVFALFIDLAQRHGVSDAAIVRWKPASRGLAYGMFAVMILVLSGGTPVPFIYFQF